MMRAILRNEKHPEYGAVTIPFPIPADQYDRCIEMLEAIETGSILSPDCRVVAIGDGLPVLQRLVGTDVNVDELDYLMKRLDSLQRTETAKFQGMAEVLDLRSVSDLINLTFCCDQVTVITDFRDLSSVGKNHYLTVHGGCAPVSELVSLDGQQLADDLIRKGTGHITPYGVIYDNGMELKQVYKGTEFPLYSYHSQEMVVGVSPAGQTDRETLMMLPMAEKELERAMRRNGMSIHERVMVRFNEVTDFALFKTAVKFSHNDMRSINAFVKLVCSLDGPEIETWQAAVNYVGVRSMEEFLAVGRNLDLFYYCFDVATPEEYGKRIIQESGHFDYDPNLDAYYDYRKYGKDRIRQEQGVFLEHGYFVYLGEQPFWELMQEQEQNRQTLPQGQGIGLY